MKFKLFIAIILTLMVEKASSQESNIWKTETQAILEVLSIEGVIDKIIWGFGLSITSYQFDGDYSRERIFPNFPPNTRINAAPIAFERSIHSSLLIIDESYDSSFYQNEIAEKGGIIWTDQAFSFIGKHKFIKSRFVKKLYPETGRLSAPLFNNEHKIAVIKYGTTNRNGRIEKPETIYILKKVENQWRIEDTIPSINNW